MRGKKLHLWRAVGALMLAAGLATAFATPRPGQSDIADVRSGPTAAEQRWADVKRTEDVALLGRVKLWNDTALWHFVVASNYAAAVEAARAAQAAADAQAAAARRQTPASAGQAPSGPPDGSGGSCYGGTPLSDTLVRNESGGRADALGPSTSSGQAWGCFQIMAGTWRGHGCAGSWGSASVEEQKACATTIYNESGRGQWSAAG